MMGAISSPVSEDQLQMGERFADFLLLACLMRVDIDSF